MEGRAKKSLRARGRLGNREMEAHFGFFSPPEFGLTPPTLEGSSQTIQFMNELPFSASYSLK